nr:MAG TPA: hypothetical protein [Caudoviricetes sp.]DAR32946.1 MAG TPA: hypothetical protein [Caudoviricetes sp.]
MSIPQFGLFTTRSVHHFITHHRLYRASLITLVLNCPITLIG